MVLSASTSLNKIIAVLSAAPDGLWIREIGRRANLDAYTVSYHVSRHPELFDEQTIDGPAKPLFRMVRLKKGALTKKSALLSRILQEHEKGA